MKHKEFEKWSAIREQGMQRFVLKKGVFTFGLFMFVLMTFIANQTPVSEHTIYHVVRQFFVWVFFGYLFGVVMWLVQEERFKSASNKST